MFILSEVKINSLNSVQKAMHNAYLSISGWYDLDLLFLYTSNAYIYWKLNKINNSVPIFPILPEDNYTDSFLTYCGAKNWTLMLTITLFFCGKPAKTSYYRFVHDLLFLGCWDCLFSCYIYYAYFFLNNVSHLKYWLDWNTCNLQERKKEPQALLPSICILSMFSL